jgi:LmbE family N-acetylglucosaminyl deacetylase
MLGLSAPDMRFLNFEDGRLEREQAAAVVAVVELLCCWQPEEVYIPYSQEPPPDHVATHRIVQAALRQCSLECRLPSPVVFEYPIWFWQHWPWTPCPQSTWRVKWHYIRDSLIHGLGLQLLRDFRRFVEISEVLEQKGAALQQHKTQMVRPASDSSWPILADVANGEFLPLFFQSYELFLERQQG